VFTVGTRGACLRGTRFLYMSQGDGSAWQMVDAFRKEQRALMWTASAPRMPLRHEDLARLVDGWAIPNA